MIFDKILRDLGGSILFGNILIVFCKIIGKVTLGFVSIFILFTALLLFSTITKDHYFTPIVWLQMAFVCANVPTIQSIVQSWLFEVNVYTLNNKHFSMSGVYQSIAASYLTLMLLVADLANRK